MSDELHPGDVYYKNPAASGTWRGVFVDSVTLSDNDDGTWVTLFWHSGAGDAINAWLPTYAPTGTPTAVTLHIRAQGASGGVGATSCAFSIVHDTGGTSPAVDFSSTLTLASDGTTHDLSIPLDDTALAAAGTDLATLLAALESGTPRALRFVATNDGHTTFLFEAWLEITLAVAAVTVAPPLRLTRRSDMFASAPSLIRSGVSRQGGNRVTGYL